MPYRVFWFRSFSRELLKSLLFLLRRVLYARMITKTPDYVEELALNLRELLLSGFTFDNSLFEADGDSIQNLDLFDHLVSGVSELAESTLLRQRAVATLLHLCRRHFLGFADGVLEGGAGNRAVILERGRGRSIGEPETTNVLDAVEKHAQGYGVFATINRDRADAMVAA